MRMSSVVSCIAVVVLSTAAGAQVPLPFQSGIEPPSKLAPALRTAIETQAKGYPFEGYREFGKDSVLLVFVDSAMTGEALRARRWMFGPPVTTAEADSCPPEKVLGRRLARIYWRAIGKPDEMQNIMVAVHGTVGLDRWSVMTMNYPHDQLARPWVGDGPPR